MKKLTAGQETFAYQVSKGASHAEAYRIAFPKSRAGKKEAVHAAAGKLMANGKVSLRIRDFKNRIEKKRVADINELAERMTSIVRLRGRHDLAISATKQLCSMMGYNPPEEHKHTILGDVSVEVAISDRIKRLEERMEKEREKTAGAVAKGKAI